MGASDSSIENARPYINYNVYAENVHEEDPTEEIVLFENEDSRDRG